MKCRFFEIQMATYDLLRPLDEIKHFHPEIEMFYRTRENNEKSRIFLCLKKNCEQVDVAEWFSDDHFQAFLIKLKDHPNLYRLELRRKLNVSQLLMKI